MPLSSLLIPFIIAGSFIIQALAPPAWVAAAALTPVELWRGAWPTLVTCLFLHAGLLHVGANTVAAAAFAPPVARRFGTGPVAMTGLLVFFLLCGALASLAYAALHAESATSLIGASGAVSGLWGAASRMLGSSRRLSPILSRGVLGQGAAFVITNLLIAFLGRVPGVLDGEDIVLIAWEAHLAGYLAGLMLIGPALAISRPREEH